MQNRAVIVDFVRTPFTKAFDPTNPEGKRGVLAHIRPDDMVVELIQALLVRNQALDPKAIETVLTGCAFPEGDQGFNMAKMAALKAGLPETVSGATVNQFCGSSMRTLHDAAARIMAGAGDVFISTGVESMSRVPMGGWNASPNPILYNEMPEAYMSMGITAENVADRFMINRSAQDQFAIMSHRKAVAAQAAGNFNKEIIVLSNAPLVTADNNIRPDANVSTMAKLKPAFKKAGSVTAGNSSPITDGASAILVVSEKFALANGLKPLAIVRSFADVGCPAEIMGMGPVASSRKALERAGLTIKDIGVVELNEAFAAQALACIQELGLDPEKVNLDGGAIALGHPLGGSGSRITGHLANVMEREDVQYGLSSMCIGGGHGIATILEKYKP
jgi:acetyl-CoA acyltransferase